MECQQHPTTPATRQCPRCLGLFCDECGKRIKAGMDTLIVCGPCDWPLVAAPEIVLSPTEDALATTRQVLSTNAVRAAAVLAAPLLLTPVPFIAPILWLFVIAYSGSYFFSVADHFARGRSGLPDASLTTGEPAVLFAEFGRALACIALLGAPVLLYLGLGRDTDLPLTIRHDGAALTSIGLVVCAFAPAGLVAVVLTGRGLAASYVPLWSRIVLAGPSSYLTLCGAFLGTASLVLACAAIAACIKVPAIEHFLIGAMVELQLLVLAALVGRYVHRHELG
jgi:hypothetical protein